MRRDLCYFYPCATGDVFNAFIQAANRKFGKDCRVISEGKTLSFGLNYSFKYNMNGGSVTVHLMPYQNGTAVDLRYTIVQLAGGRYKAHARDLTLYTDGILRAKAQPISIDVNAFLSYEQNSPEIPAPPVQKAPAQPVPAKTAPADKKCPKCGRAASPSAKFCAGCGNQFETVAYCQNCGAALQSGAMFCTNCGFKKA